MAKVTSCIPINWVVTAVVYRRWWFHLPLDASGSGTCICHGRLVGGLIYQLTDQVTFDVGYRFYQLGDILSRGQGPDINTPALAFGKTATVKSSGEDLYGIRLGYIFIEDQAMFYLRMFEPLRSLLR